jgi:hypothetical protein
MLSVHVLYKRRLQVNKVPKILIRPVPNIFLISFRQLILTFNLSTVSNLRHLHQVPILLVQLYGFSKKFVGGHQKRRIFNFIVKQNRFTDGLYKYIYIVQIYWTLTIGFQMLKERRRKKKKEEIKRKGMKIITREN